MLAVGDWLATISLIFGGCCSNAITLEILTGQYSPAGSLITFAQFLLVSLVGLRNHLVIRPSKQSVQAVVERVANDLHSRIATQSSASLVIYGPSVSTETVNDFATALASYVIHHLQLPVDIRPLSEHPPPDAPSLGLVVYTSYDESPLTPLLEYDSLLLFQTANDRLHAQLLRKATFVLESVGSGCFAVHRPASRFSFNPFKYRFKPRNIPLSRYAIQVILFLAVSLLNNAAFGFHIPMSVHIVFRSGGLVVNMLMGRLIQKRSYSRLQLISILIVTFGIGLTTVSAMVAKPRKPTSSTLKSLTLASSTSAETHSMLTYSMGIMILTLALIISGFLGLFQDWTFDEYGRGHWEESMFYLHAMALPLFSFVAPQLVNQIRLANASPVVSLGLNEFARAQNTHGLLPPLPYVPWQNFSFSIPSFYIPLIANVLSQLVCVAGVNRLTSRVSSLTVTLALVVRKAVSLAISVILLGGSRGNTYLWAGAAAVLTGTIGYTIASTDRPNDEKKKK